MADAAGIISPYDQATGPDAEARQAGYSSWFTNVAGILRDLDSERKASAPMVNNGVSVGIAPDGSLFVQGQAAGADGKPAVATAAISPVLILGAVLAYVVLTKG